LIPLGQAGEIFPAANLQVVPYVKPWFLGVLNIRGGLYGVVDLARFVASETAVPVAAPAVAEPSVITINPMLEVNCALQVDSLLGLRGGDAFSSSSSPPAEAPGYFGNRFLDAEGGSWQEIDLRLLAHSSQFLSISA
jgi:twitching motility protein PilI